MAVQAKLNWTDGFQFVARAENGPGIVLDSSDGGSGPTPMQMVLMGVAGCTAMDVVSILKKKRASITDLHVNISGDQAEEHPKRYTHINIEFVVHGRGVKPQVVERSIELSVTKYCSAMASVNANVEHTYRIVEDEA
ncbi:MAG: OsmC family protein [Deltaproteobacteria bacterium]|nr:MAG: OsmC family protein [Deltaproteobacteria bacterium]